MSRISFVILHYGNIEITKRCLQSIWNLETVDELSVVLVDNDGIENYHQNIKRENMLKMIESVNDGTGRVNVILLSMPCGYGFSKANNEGYIYAKDHFNPDYIIVVNNDVIFFQRDILMRMQISFEKWKWEVLGPDIIGSDGVVHQNPIGNKGRSILQIDYTILANVIGLGVFALVYPIIQWNYQRMKRIKTQHNNKVIHEYTVNEKLNNCSETIIGTQHDIVPCGACLIFSKEFVNNENFVFIPETQFYYEEYILYERCKRAGYQIMYDSSLKVIHEDGVATKIKTKSNKERLRFVMQQTLNSAKIYRSYLKK